MENYIMRPQPALPMLLIGVLASFTAASCLFDAKGAVNSSRPTPGEPTFCDRFDAGKLDQSKWNIATYKTPDSKPGVNTGVYAPEALDFSCGMLRISVNQTEATNGVYSTGGAIFSKDRFGYGTYEFVMRMTSPSSTPGGPGEAQGGAVSSGFLYSTNSESEIDLEFVGDHSAMWITSWHNPNPTNPPDSAMRQSVELANHDLATGFHTYTLAWEPGRIQVFIDGALATARTQDIPSAPARIILQHRGTNSSKWGGLAKVGVTRYAYFKSVKFTPMGAR